MITTTYKNLSESKEEFDNILTGLGLKLESNTWLYNAYSIVKELSNIYTDTAALDEFKREKNKNGEIHFCLSDLSLIEYVLGFIKNEDLGILKEKFQNILKMDFPPIENEVSSNARNVLWELILLSHLKKANIKANLKDPNPDILAHLNSQNYYIECKRILSPQIRALRRNIKNAIDQLNKILLNDNDDDSIGILALSIEQPITKNNMIFLSGSEQEGRKKLKLFIRGFIDSNKKLWQKIIKNRKIVAIMVHMVMPAITKTQQGDVFGNAFQLTLSNVWADAIGFQSIANDFNNVLKILEQ